MFWINGYLVAAGLNGSVEVYDGKTGERTAVITGHMSEILDMCYNSNVNKLITSSDDGSSKVFEYVTHNSAG
jgi:WD40 repeat protein